MTRARCVGGRIHKPIAVRADVGALAVRHGEVDTYLDEGTGSVGGYTAGLDEVDFFAGVIGEGL